LKFARAEAFALPAATADNKPRAHQATGLVAARGKHRVLRTKRDEMRSTGFQPVFVIQTDGLKTRATV